MSSEQQPDITASSFTQQRSEHTCVILDIEPQAQTGVLLTCA